MPSEEVRLSQIYWMPIRCGRVETGEGGGYGIGGGLKKFPAAVEGPNPGCWYAPLGTLRRVCPLLVLDSRSLVGGISCSAVEQTLGEYGAVRCGHTGACNRLSNGGEEPRCLDLPGHLLSYDNKQTSKQKKSKGKGFQRTL